MSAACCNSSSGIGDLNHDLITFFDVLRSQPDALIRQLELTPYGRVEYRRAWERPSELDPIEQARRFYVRSRQAFGSGEGEQRTGWRYETQNTRHKSLMLEWNELEHLWQVAARLKQVQIECDDAHKIIRRFDTPDTLFYVDPPYVASTRYSKTGYQYEMTDRQHEQLADLLKSVKGMVILSGYNSLLYQALYPDWQVTSKATRTNGRSAIEYLWLSPHTTKRLGYNPTNG